MFFKFAPKPWSTVLFQKNELFSLKTLFIGKTVFLEKSSFFCNKTVNQRSGSNFQKRVFCKILLQISCFFKLFSAKNAGNDYFDQHLECAAPKMWESGDTNMDRKVLPPLKAGHRGPVV